MPILQTRSLTQDGMDRMEFRASGKLSQSSGTLASASLSFPVFK